MIWDFLKLLVLSSVVYFILIALMFWLRSSVSPDDYINIIENVAVVGIAAFIIDLVRS